MFKPRCDYNNAVGCVSRKWITSLSTVPVSSTITTLSRDVNRVMCYVILIARYTIPVAQDAILVWDSLKTISIIARIVERFQESMVKLYRD